MENSVIAHQETIDTRTTLRARVNGEAREARATAGRTLLDVIRDDWGLTGAKRGCDIGACGSCAVVLNGKAVLSCIVPAEKAHDGIIETVEGLCQNGQLHPLQQGFIDAHGFQCGICTSGFLMSAKALVDKHPDPTEKQIEQAIHKNICRCTGYNQLVEAIKLACGQMTVDELDHGTYRTARVVAPVDGTPEMPVRELNVVGKPHARIESRSRVDGSAKYTADIAIAGVLHGVTVRADRASADILAVDINPAIAVDGVIRVLTHLDIPGENAYGKVIRDQLVFAVDQVRYFGEPIGLVIADTPQAARKGADAVRITYGLRPGVYDPEAAMAADAPQVHKAGNILSHYHLEKGEVDSAWSQCAHVIERRYTTHPQDHSPIEPEAAISHWDNDGHLVVISPGQSVFFDRLNICRALGIPKDDVICVQPAIGAAYGKREDIYAQIHCALATLVTGKPVRMEYTREETMYVTTKRTQLRTNVKGGCDAEGRLVALEARVVGDCGAYASWSVNIMRKAGVLVSGPYSIPNIRVDSYAVYTNNPMTGATRGFGAAETAFCTESFMDELAHAAGIDPVEFRLKNALRPGMKSATDFQLPGPLPVVETIKEALNDYPWQKPLAPHPDDPQRYKRGKGMATIWYGIGFGSGIEDTPGVIAELHEDGSATIRVGTVDYGNGSNTTFAMMAAEMLGTTVENIHVINGDSSQTLNCGSTVATKQTYTTGNAVVVACAKIRADIDAIAAQLFGVTPERITAADGIYRVANDGNRTLTLTEIAGRFQEFGKPKRREGRFAAGAMTAPLDKQTGLGKAWFPMAYGTQIAEVTVDTKTGKIVVDKLVAAHYVGRAINPRAVRGQVVGGVSFGIGFALTEDSKYVDGICQNVNYDKYKLMRVNEAPPVMVIAVEQDETTGPFGAIGVGEPPTLGPAPAIANAVHDAIGVRIRDLPITPDKIKEALTTRR
ncbi:MAG: molybdopterin-dependent oxidoreductase [candidate division Zixibacteria bacterium]|nr:molybdopterin-dependent oxidoreductase [candidate division Zixibacteria bacterium]